VEGASAKALNAGGPFEAVLPGFAPREEQLQLAAAIEHTIASGGTLVAEAGTGIGKTLSYLVPVLESRERTIISTGTKTLQDQLYFRDLPIVKKALGSTLKTALLKGRANYLCLYRMEQARTEGRLPSRDSVSELEDIRQWVPVTEDGDLSISSVIAEDSELWPLVTSTAENCLGSDCPRFEECFVVRARREAQEADVVVVNHHLLFADMAIKQSGFGEVLPGAAVFIVDEAHQAPETASQFFSTSLSSRQISDLCSDILAEAAETSGGLATVRSEVAHCRQTLKEFQAACADTLDDRGTWQEMLVKEWMLASRDLPKSWRTLTTSTNLCLKRKCAGSNAVVAVSQFTPRRLMCRVYFPVFVSNWMRPGYSPLQLCRLTENSIILCSNWVCRKRIR